MKRSIELLGACILGTGMLLAGTLQSSFADPAAKAVAGSDATFVEKAALDGMAEEKLGALASKKGESEKVKEFGETMQKDHAEANAKLKKTAKSKSISCPEELDAEHAATEKKLTSLSGEAFDRAYAQEMVSAHKKAVSLFESQAENGKDADLKQFAKETLPVLKTHLQHAQDLASAH